MNVGDLVFIKPGRGNNSHYPFDRTRATKGVIFSQIDKDWFRVYATWGERTKIADYPRWMLEIVSGSR